MLGSVIIGGCDLVGCVTKASFLGTCWVAVCSAWAYRRLRRGSVLTSVCFYVNFILSASLACWWVAMRLGVTPSLVVPQLLSFVLSPSKRRYCLLLFWLLCFVASAVFLVVGSRTQKMGRISTEHRKFFHLTVSLICASGLQLDPNLTFLASTLVACAFVVIECVRALGVRPFGRLVNDSCVAFLDDRQESSSGLVLTPFYLLAGTFLPLWLLHRPSSSVAVVTLPYFAGIVSVGVGDSLAALIGKNYGRWRWRRTGKSLEGSLAAIVGQTAALLLIDSSLLRSSSGGTVIGFLLCSTLIAMVEFVCVKMDNIIVPVFAFLLFILCY